ncbi:DNA-processing protein DprA [Salibacterium halotolerans]|uniref:DNA processing protein n=1 Tax=Salibacterium halotolerans TaxID=1884432 RepID=A0A1I5MC64_9BACI|nr:DNA-processing protein DprA [Salibacterium halotolerans]SFP07083.1 DNA processing protein [Salibacterium halotolerans]
MPTETTRLLTLHEAPHMTWKRIAAIHGIDPTFTTAYHLSATELASCLYLQPLQASALHRFLHSTERTPAFYREKGIEILTPFMEEYPERLRHIYDPPWVIYAKGRTNLLHSEKSLAVVGTRKLTSYGMEALEELLPPVMERGTVIISGLAAGTDAAAHKLTIRKKGVAIAVLGAGFDHIYPRENTALFHHLSRHHLLLSEFAPDTPPRKWQFPMRNRIISGLSDAVFITEAASRSGSLITAYQALEQGRDVKVLPGSIFSPMSAGTNQLIKEGAAPVMSADDLLDPE